MKLQIKPHRWCCLVTSFAMALDMPVTVLMAEIGHDGSELLFDDLPEPAGRRGFHIQECIAVAIRQGFAVTPIELCPVARWPNGVELSTTPGGYWARINQTVATSRGIIYGLGRRVPHAMAYDHGHIYDPDGREFDYSKAACEARGFITQCVWRIDRIDNGAMV